MKKNNEEKKESKIEVSNEDSNPVPLLVTEQVESVEDSEEGKPMDEFVLIEGIQDADSNE